MKSNKRNALFFRNALVAIVSVVALISIEQNLRAACEIEDKNGKVVFKCKGEDEICKEKKLGYTLKCSGVKVAVSESDIEP